ALSNIAAGADRDPEGDVRRHFSRDAHQQCRSCAGPLETVGSTLRAGLLRRHAVATGDPATARRRRRDRGRRYSRGIPLGARVVLVGVVDRAAVILHSRRCSVSITAVIANRPGGIMQIEFWFEFASTYSYPAAMRAEALAASRGVGIAWRP